MVKKTENQWWQDKAQTTPLWDGDKKSPIMCHLSTISCGWGWGGLVASISVNTCLAQRRVSTQNKLVNGSLEAKFGYEIPSVLGYKKDTGHKKQSQSEGRGFCSSAKTYRDLGSCFQSVSWVLWFARRGLLVSHWIETSESPKRCEAGRAGPQHLLQQMAICTFHLGKT